MGFSHCSTCGQEYDSAGRCGCLTTYGTAGFATLVAEPSAEKLRELAALERIATALERIAAGSPPGDGPRRLDE